jgi:ubiquinone/menaquinone biosynthesis C-methylase UbiE
MTLRSDYDLWHQRIYDAGPSHDDASSPWYRLVGEYLGSVAGLSVLEVACGRGGFTSQLAQAGARVTACDFSSAALHATSAKLQADGHSGIPVSLAQADAQNLPFAANSFDRIVSCETIEHLPQVRSALKEMHRVTRPGGRLFLTTPNYANFMGLYDLYARVRHPHRHDDQPFDRRQIFLQIRRWLRQAGWKILRTDGTVHQFPFRPGHNPLRWRSLESIPAIRKLLSPFALTYFVMAEKLS